MCFALEDMLCLGGYALSWKVCLDKCKNGGETPSGEAPLYMGATFISDGAQTKVCTLAKWCTLSKNDVHSQK